MISQLSIEQFKRELRKEMFKTDCSCPMLLADAIGQIAYLQTFHVIWCHGLVKGKRREWFPVEMTMREDLPGDEVSVFVTDGEYVDVGCFDFDDGLWMTALGFVDPDHVTHWMEIPSPGELASFFVPMNERKETPKESVSVTKDKQKISYQEMYEFVARYMHQEGILNLDCDMYLNADMLTINVSETKYISPEVDYASTNDMIDVNYLFEDKSDEQE